MDTIEVKILNYVFQFRQLLWREEAAITPPKDDVPGRFRAILSHALAEVSGIKVESPKDAMKVLRVLPDAVVQRVFVMYKGSAPAPRRFSTVGLYKAPEPGKFINRIAEVEQQRDQVMDRVEREMEAKFGRKELEETLAAEREMLKNSKMRGATRATPDENRFGTTPPVKFPGNAPPVEPPFDPSTVVTLPKQKLTKDEDE